jgi:hypothetical protein
LLLLAGAATVAFLFAVSQRLLYPHELEWMEGALADHAARVADGLPLYCEPQAEHVPFLYAPLLFWLGGLGMKLGLDGILALRLIAVAFSIGSALLIGHWVRKETNKSVPGLVATGLFFAGYGWLAWWYDLARNDSLFVFLCIATTYQLRHGGKRNWLWAGLLATLALLAKQSTLMWLPIVGIGALLWDWRVAIRFGLISAAAMSLSIGLLHLSTDGWSTLYLFQMPQHHGWVGDRKLGFWTEDMLPTLPLLALAFTGFVAGWREGNGKWSYMAAFFAGGIACSWMSRMHVGGFDNVMMYGFASACVLGPIAATHSSKLMRIAGPIALIVQFAWLGFEAWQRNPSTTLFPPAAHQKAHEELRAVVEAQNGPVWIPAHGHIAYRAGKGTGAHGQAIFDVMQMLPKLPNGMFDLAALADPSKLQHLPELGRDALAALMDNTVSALREKFFAALIIDEIGTGQFPVLFGTGMVGPDGKFGTDDDPYIRLPGHTISEPAAIKAALGFVAHTPYMFARRD